MMNWTDEGVVLSARKHGEHAVIVQLLTRAHGRHAGLVRGGAGARGRGMYLPGNKVGAGWRGRLAEHLGSYSCELIAAPAAVLLDEPLRLSALTAACAVAETALPEREEHPRLYAAFCTFLDHLDGGDWLRAFVEWELILLTDLGYGLDLAACAATGSTDDLAYVSPKSGRAVSRQAGAPYRERLLPLPGFLIGQGEPDEVAVSDGLVLTGYFLESRVYTVLERQIPAARIRFVDRLRRPATIYSR
ncbi:MAG: DNA repair protein RecO [Alphaproteobacteria bacterium]|nr:DNA repair protein RecO [Alphaproteobacteria bacterium]